MATDRSISTVTDEFLKAILATRRRQRRLLSSTFWEKFGFKSRTKERVADVKKALLDRGIQIIKPGADEFGVEEPSEWIVLGTGTKVPPDTTPPRPKDEWFTKMAQLTFESEREVDAQSYAYWLCAPYYLVTNANEIHAYENLGAPHQPIQVIAVKRDELGARWNDFATKLNKKAVIARKAQLADTLNKARAVTP